MTLPRREILTFFDFWRQQNSSKPICGCNTTNSPASKTAKSKGDGNPAYTNAIKVLDEDMDQYIHDNTDDEITTPRSLTPI
jgi:hypothetical protein